MRVRTAARAAVAVALLAVLGTACSGSSDSGGPSTKESRSASKDAATKETPAVDCSDEGLSQSDWVEHCSDGGDSEQSTGLKFGQEYTWPDGLKVSVASAKVFTDYDSELGESAKPGETDFRVTLKLENTGKTPVALDDLSVIIEGATNGGQAASTAFERGSEPLEGRLAPGVSATKTDDNVLETKYGRKVVVTVQRASEDFDLKFPEFTGEITE